MSGTPSSRSNRVSAYDGIRGIAIVAVVAYHVSPGLVPFGAIGVTVFFVLSGYLISRLMLNERTSNGRFDYAAFYARRAIRLFPALIVLVIGMAVLMIVVRDPQLTSSYPVEAILALLYLGDIAQPLHQPMPVLGHTWSLAVEEQFYLVWPVILLVLLLRMSRGNPRRVLYTVATMTAVAGAWRLLVTFTSDDIQRFYFAPDTNAFPLLVGALLAVMPEKLPWLGRRLPWLALASTALLVAICVVPISGDDLGHWRLQMLAGTLAALIAAVLVYAATPAGSFLSSRPLVWTGRISYGWYLWHAAIVGLRPRGELLFDSAPKHVVAVLLALLIAVLSYYYIEIPLQRWLRPRFERTRGLLTAKGDATTEQVQ